MDFSNILGTVSLSGNGAATRSGSSGSIAVGLRNLNVRFPEASHTVWVRRIRIFGTSTVVTITPSAGAVNASVAYEAPTAQVETATAAGTITVAGNAVATVTGAGLAAPVAVSFAVALGDTATAWAAKARAAISANAQIAAKYDIIQPVGASAAIVLRRVVDDYGFPNDGTMNIALADDTSAGITEAATSANTTAGEVGQGALIETEIAVDAEGLVLGHYGSGLRAFLCQGVRGKVLYTADPGFAGAVAAGGVLFAAAPTDGTELVTDAMDIELLSEDGVAEVYVVLVTTSA